MPGPDEPGESAEVQPAGEAAPPDETDPPRPTSAPVLPPGSAVRTITPGSDPSPPPSPTAVRSALATLPVRPAGESFWNQLDMVVAEEQPMQITPRPAIRPITEPPPRAGGAVGVEDMFERSGQPRSDKRARGRHATAVGAEPASGMASGSPGSSNFVRRAILILLVLAALAGLAALGGIFDDPDSDGTETGEDAASQEDDRPGRDADGEGGRAEGQAPPDGQADQGSSNAPTTTTTEPPPEGLEPDVPLHAGGLGPLRPGAMTLADVEQEVGVSADIDRQAFTGSGGACFEAFLPGAEDVTLWIRNPEPSQPLANEDDGVLVAITIGEQDLRSERLTDQGLGLGVSEEDLVSWYQGGLSQTSHPYYPGGSIYLDYSDDGSGNGIGYVVGSGEVIEIRVGAASLIQRPHVCA